MPHDSYTAFIFLNCMINVIKAFYLLTGQRHEDILKKMGDDFEKVIIIPRSNGEAAMVMHVDVNSGKSAWCQSVTSQRNDFQDLTEMYLSSEEFTDRLDTLKFLLI